MYPPHQPELTEIEESTSALFFAIISLKLPQLYSDIYNKKPFNNELVNVFLWKDKFEDLRQSIYSTLINYKSKSPLEVHFWTHNHFDTLYKARRTIINTCETTQSTTQITHAQLEHFFATHKVDETSPQQDIDTFCSKLKTHVFNGVIFALIDYYNIHADEVLSYFGEGRVEYLWYKGFFMNFETSADILKYMGETETLRDEVVYRKMFGKGNSFFGEKDVNQKLVGMLIKHTIPEVQERCIMTNTDPQILVPMFLLRLNLMAFEYKNRKLHMFDIHDYQMDPARFIRWAKLFVKTNEKPDFLKSTKGVLFSHRQTHAAVVRTNHSWRSCQMDGYH